MRELLGRMIPEKSGEWRRGVRVWISEEDRKSGWVGVLRRVKFELTFPIRCFKMYLS